jgi:hypothetical protein
MKSFFKIADNKKIQFNSGFIERKFFQNVIGWKDTIEKELIWINDFFNEDSFQLFMYSKTLEKNKHPDLANHIIGELNEIISLVNFSEETLEYEDFVDGPGDRKEFRQMLKMFFGNPTFFCGKKFCDTQKFIKSGEDIRNYIVGPVPILIPPVLSNYNKMVAVSMCHFLYFEKRKAHAMYLFIFWLCNKNSLSIVHDDEEAMHYEMTREHVKTLMPYLKYLNLGHWKIFL